MTVSCLGQINACSHCQHHMVSLLNEVYQRDVCKANLLCFVSGTSIGTRDDISAVLSFVYCLQLQFMMQNRCHISLQHYLRLVVRQAPGKLLLLS